MKKAYVPKTLTEFLSESKSIPLKRKYGERPAIMAGTNAPLRNQVLSFVAESGAVSKIDLKKFIVGLKEGGATPAAANMFIKRNAKYFIAESRNGVTYFKLSNLGQRLVNQFVPAENGNVSESVKNARRSLSMLLESTRKNRKVNEEFDDDEDEEEWDNELDKYESPDEFFDEVREILADEEGFSPEKIEEFMDDNYETLEGLRMEHTPDGAITLILHDSLAWKSKNESKKSRGRKLNEDDEEMPKETEEFDVPEDEMEDGEIEAAEVDGEGPAAEVEFEEEDEPEEDEDGESDQFEYEEDDEKIVVTFWKNGSGEKEEMEEPEEDEDFDPEEGEELEPEEGEEMDDEEDLEGRPEDEEPREFDFKDKGRPGILGMDESMTAQFVSHKLAGKKSSKLAGRYGKEYHNLLDDSEEKDEKELDSHLVKAKEGKKLHEKSESRLAGRYGKEYHNLLDDNDEDDPKFGSLEDEVTESSQKASKLGKKYKEDYHNLLDEPEDKDNDEIKDFDKEVTENVHDKRVKRMREIIENLRNKRGKFLNEADEPTEDDELKDEDLDSIDTTPEEGEETETTEETPEEGEVEKVEITEFIITVDDVDSALSELEELGVTAERVAVEAPVEEVPAPEEEPAPEETPAEGEEAPAEEGGDIDLDLGGEAEAEATKESFRRFVAGILNEAEEETTEEAPVEGEDAGASDELGLGDQGEDATELEEPAEGEETTEPTTEFEENKIKVKAEDWDTLKGWLEEKGVDVKEMFGGDIETEEVDSDAEATEEPAEEVSDEDIDFSGIGDEDKTKVEDEEEGKVKEGEYPLTAEKKMQDAEEERLKKLKAKPVEECDK